MVSEIERAHEALARAFAFNKPASSCHLLSSLAIETESEIENESKRHTLKQSEMPDMQI
jgi:hypothetical protein